VANRYQYSKEGDMNQALPSQSAGTGFKAEKLAKTRSNKLWLSTASTHCLRPRRRGGVYSITLEFRIIVGVKQR
jgi:hypothetical protein